MKLPYEPYGSRDDSRRLYWQKYRMVAISYYINSLKSVCLSVCLCAMSTYHLLDWVFVLQMRYFLFGKKIELVYCALIEIGIRLPLKLLRIATMGT
jgi:hypothetical protein